MADETTVNKPAETDAKSEKPARKKKGPGLFRRIGKYFRDTKSEFKKIIWPTFPSVVRNTVVTLAVCLILGALICLVDAGLSALIQLALSLA